MRILIIGAGVTGSIFASYLINSKEKLEKKFKESVDITLLARGTWYKKIRENGLKINHYHQKITTIDSIPVINSLESNDRFDFVLIFLRKTQVTELLPSLSSNGSANFVFIGNNGTGAEVYKKSIPPKKIILGFPGVGGSRDSESICSVYRDTPLITMGSALRKNKRPLKKLKKNLKIAQLRVILDNNMDSWLKYRLSVITPLAHAIYLDGGNHLSLSRNNEILKVMVKAIKEGYRALKDLKHPVRPVKLMSMMSFPDILIRRRFKKMLTSEEGKLSIYNHCQAAPEEMREISMEFQQIIEKTTTKRENLDRVFSLYRE
jgi:2-dehydropantoate 2-reductase